MTSCLRSSSSGRFSLTLSFSCEKCYVQVSSKESQAKARITTSRTVSIAVLAIAAGCDSGAESLQLATRPLQVTEPAPACRCSTICFCLACVKVEITALASAAKDFASARECNAMCSTLGRPVVRGPWLDNTLCQSKSSARMEEIGG